MEESPPLLAPQTDTKIEEAHQPKAEKPQTKASSTSKRGKPAHSALDNVQKNLQELKQPEEKLQYLINCMQDSLAQEGSPHFKNFWDARSLCSSLFKEVEAPALRSTLWTQYTELSKEARRLKNILDEQSSFAVEQIEIAVKALEEELSKIDELSAIPQCPHPARTIYTHLDFYTKQQAILTHLNIASSKISALRQELGKTGMRIRKKNEFFERLSKLGDLVFPRRKELMNKLSQQFEEDISQFKSIDLVRESQRGALFELRDEIKQLQALTKWLTLTSPTFNRVRQELSLCWDQMKQLEQDKRKERSEERQQQQAVIEQFQQKLQQLQQHFESGSLTLQAALDQFRELSQELRRMRLHREDAQSLREQLQKAQDPVFAKQKEEELQREAREREMAEQKKQKVAEMRSLIDSLLQEASQLDADSLKAKMEAVQERIQTTFSAKSERLEHEKRLKSLKDIIAEKKEQKLMNLSSDEREALQQLEEVLRQRLERKQEIKDQIEQLRRAGGNSNLDFARAMEYNAQLAQEKERLDKLNQGIIEIEQKIASLERG